MAEPSETNHAIALLEAIDYRGQEGSHNAIWRSTLMRVASRPADVVFSIMGLLGVALNPLRFDSDDRHGVTIALMQALLRNGARAEWLGAAPGMEINPEIPTLPRFPIMSLQGKAFIKNKDGISVLMSQEMGFIWYRLVGAPFGSMHDDGTLTIQVQVFPIRQQFELIPTEVNLHPVDSQPNLNFTPSQVICEPTKSQTITPYAGTDAWYPAPSQQGPPYAVKVGKKDWYGNGAVGVVVDPTPWLVMLADSDRKGKGEFVNLGYASTSDEFANMMGWVERDIVIAARVSIIDVEK
ncbi:hypothetical protein GQ44DRAFT_828195 [Phaeosphaeriaceae sp. PMI808]|nr:hypothetical protein GQ44DRAFT_828195 [Phaeosphaeriaceae sp. PMI808]